MRDTRLKVLLFLSLKTFPMPDNAALKSLLKSSAMEPAVMPIILLSRLRTAMAPSEL